MGYFAQAAVATIRHDEEMDKPTAEIAIWQFLNDAFISWEAANNPPDREWVVLSPGTLFALTQGTLAPIHVEHEVMYSMRPVAMRGNRYRFEFDLQGHNEHERLLLHVVLPPYCLPVFGSHPAERRRIVRDEDCHVRVAEDQLALTFFDTGRLFVKIDYARVDHSRWEHGLKRGIFRLSMMDGFIGAFSEWTADVSAKLISELADR